MTSTRIWNSGPPPHPGWWNASTLGNESMWYWWDGEGWYGAVDSTRHPLEAAEIVACVICRGTTRIQWTDYYPHDARVPRVILE